MKTNSLKIFQDMYQAALEGTTTNSLEVKDLCLNDIVTYIEKIMNLEDNQAKAKFNPYNYCTKVSNKPALEYYNKFAGIHHEGGYKVASDCHILIAYKEAYKSELEGKTLMESGEFTPELPKYPNWRQVIPEDKNWKQVETVVLDHNYIKELATQAKALKKLKVTPYINIKGTTFPFSLFEKLENFALQFGIDKVKVIPGKYCYINTEDAKAVIMPIVLSNGKQFEEAPGINKVFQYC